jgi:hypothetical protein
MLEPIGSNTPKDEFGRMDEASAMLSIEGSSN